MFTQKLSLSHKANTNCKLHNIQLHCFCKLSMYFRQESFTNEHDKCGFTIVLDNSNISHSCLSVLELWIADFHSSCAILSSLYCPVHVVVEMGDSQDHSTKQVHTTSIPTV